MKGFLSVKEKILLSIEKANENLTNRLLVRVIDQVVEDVSVRVDVTVNLLCFIAYENLENLAKVAAEDRIQLLCGIKEGKESLKELVFVSP